MSSVESTSAPMELRERPGLVRLTASDRPGVAQPVPERDIPSRPWGPILLGAVLMASMLLLAWELHWRAYGASPSYRNSDGLWTQQRRRIDHGEGGATVLLGSSRTLSDVQLPVWERLSGERPIQLALEGTSPLIPLEQLAEDPDFTGRLLVDITPQLFGGGSFGGGLRASAFALYRDEGPSQRAGQWLSMHLLEPHFAFYEPDFALDRIARRQPWPLRDGLPYRPTVRKLFVGEADRNSRLWAKVERDPEYLALVRATWGALNWDAPPPPPERQQRMLALREESLQRVAAAVVKLRARGVAIVFVRHPISGPYLEYENRTSPRADTWDALLARTGVAGLHFEDHPELQGFDAPEWSHLSASEADRYTAALVPLVEQAFARADAPKAR
jgi:hypothetical protein